SIRYLHRAFEESDKSFGQVVLERRLLQVAMGIDFRLSENQIALRDGARAFAKGVLKDVRTTIRKYAKAEDRFYAIRPFLKQAVDAGFVKGLFPQEVGGTDISTLDFAVAAEELCVVDVNVPSAMLGNRPLRQARHHVWDG